MLCDDVIEDDLFVEGEGEVLNSVFPSAAVVGSAASSLSGVILTEGLMASSSDKDEDRRSVREAREEAMAKEGVPDAKESKKKRVVQQKTQGGSEGLEKCLTDTLCEHVGQIHLSSAKGQLQNGTIQKSAKPTQTYLYVTTPSLQVVAFQKLLP